MSNKGPIKSKKGVNAQQQKPGQVAPTIEPAALEEERPKPARPAAGPEPMVVGRVCDDHGSPISGVRVVLFRKQVTGRIEVGRTRTDKSGRYRIPLVKKGAKKPTAIVHRDLSLEVLEARREKMLASATVAINPGRAARMDVTVRNAVPIHHALRAKLVDAGAMVKGKLIEGKDEELVKLTGLKAPQLARFKVSAAMAKDLKLPEDFAFAALSGNLVKDERTLLATSPDRLRRLIARAVDRKEVDTPKKQELDKAIERVQVLAVDRMKAGKMSDKHLLMGDVLRLAAVDDRRARSIAQHWHRHESSPERFWRAMTQDKSLTKDNKQQLRVACELGYVAEGNPLVAAVLKARLAGSATKELVNLQAADVQSALTKNHGKSATLPKEGVVRLIARIKDAYPTAAHVHDAGVELGAKAAKLIAPVVDALNKDAKFDLLTTAVEPWLQKNKAFGSLGEAERMALMAALKKRQRIARIGATYGEGKIVLGSYGSAAEIVQKGRTRFLELLGPGIGIERAVELYEQAEDTNAKTTALLLQYGPVLPNTGPRLTIAPEFTWDLTPELGTLFQDKPLCACERCRSITGYAAYLVDLLQFLRDPDNNDPARTNALQALIGIRKGKSWRRPDIGEIELSCANTNTPIPYLDIVLEVLENAVAQPGSLTRHQTTWKADELELASEHFDQAAYDIVADKLFPFTLPFDINYEQIRLLHQELGTSRSEMLAVFKDLAQIDPAVDRDFTTPTREAYWTSIVAAGEEFGLAPKERDIITGNDRGGRPILSFGVYWGYAGNRANWIEDLKVLDVFMQRSKLSHREVIELVNLKAILGNKKLELKPTEALNTMPAAMVAECDPKLIKLVGLDHELAERMHRFIRLYRRTGWTMRELDRALMALGDRAPRSQLRLLDEQFLLRLAHVQRICRRTGASLAEVSSWWAPMDRADYNAEGLPIVRSLYQEVFEGNRAAQRDGTGFPLDQLAAAGMMDGSAMERLSVLLGVPVVPLEALATALNVMNARIDPFGLADLYRHVSLARCMGLSIPVLLQFMQLTNAPFFGASTDAHMMSTLRFMDRWESFRASGLALDTVLYFVGGIDRPTASLAPSAPAIASLRTTIEVAIRPAGMTTEQRQASILSAVAEEFSIDAVILAPLLGQWLVLPSGNSFMTELLILADPARSPEFERIYAGVHAFAWFNSLCGPLAVEEVEWIFSQAPASGFLDLRTLSSVAANTPQRTSRFAAWHRWERWMELRKGIAVPMRKELVTLFALGSAPQTMNTAQVERAAYVTQLVSITGWDPLDVGLLLGKFDETTGHRMSILGTSFRRHFRDEQLPHLLTSCLSYVRKTGLSVSQLSVDALLYREPVQFAPQRIRAASSALRAKLDDAGWTAASKRIADTMREKRRRALVDHLVHDLGLKNSADLYDHFLLDVEMGACRMTTRIQAAVHSVQLFADRCLMNLERDVTITPDGGEQWGWMKSYPIWEANRKIFLYPENFLRPEFRDDRSPFFKDFESELQQNDLTNATAEEALLHYLEKVDGVSRLQICGIYVEEGHKGWKKGVPEVVHVFGRTRNSPHVYYYRKWLKGLRWTPWEKVDADIDGDHLIPVVYFGRVYLFWPIISEKDGGPFNMDAFLRPMMDFLALITSVARTGGAVVGAVIGAYNQLVEAIERSIEEIIRIPVELAGGDPDTLINLDGFKILPEAFEDLPDNPLEEALNAIAAGMRLVLDTLSMNPGIQLMEALLPKKEYEIKMAWSELKHGSWSAKRLCETSLSFRDLTGPLMRQMDRAVELTEDRMAADSAFDRKRLFTFNAVVEAGDHLVVQAHVTRYGLDIANDDTDGQYLKFLGDYVLDDAHGQVTARKPPVGSFDFANDVLANLQEVFAAVIQDALQFVTGEPVTQDDDPHGYLKQELVPALLQDVRPYEYRMQAAHQYQKRWFRRGGVGGVFHPSDYRDNKDELDDQFFLQTSLLNYWYYNGTFQTHFHPFIGELMRQLNRHGIDAPGLMDPSHQNWVDRDQFEDLGPTDRVWDPKPVSEFDYTPQGAYALYNWELFIHAPLLIAEKLMTQHRHQEAERWLHFVFDPTDRRDLPGVAKYWRPRVFAQTATSTYHQQSIRRLLLDLSGAGTEDVRSELESHVDAWRHDAFNPFAVARLRTTAFQRSVVMTYVRNLTEWGDRLFRAEDVNGAALLYRRAEQIMGPRPPVILPSKSAAPRSYTALVPSLDAFSNALVELEQYVTSWSDGGTRPPAFLTTDLHLAVAPADPKVKGTGKKNKPAKSKPEKKPIHLPWREIIGTGWHHQVTSVQDLYFCIPRNEKLHELWDTLEERQWKLRNCRGLDGGLLDAQLPEGLLEPALAERARDLGMDLGSLLANGGLPMPHYRYSVMVQHAIDLANDVKALGAAFLGALEKRDGEQLARIRQEQELAMLNKVRRLKQLAIDESDANLKALELTRAGAEIRMAYHERNLAEPLSPLELAQLGLVSTSIGLQVLEAGIMGVSSALSLVPNFLGGFPVAAAESGGSYLSSSSERAAKALGTTASILNSIGGLVGTMAGYDRRSQEWTHQLDLVTNELKQIDRQMIAAQVRRNMVVQELDNHTLQFEQSLRNDEFLRSKFTNLELYDFMVGELTRLHDTAYSLAFDAARQAELAFRMELGKPLDGLDRHIGLGHWDSLRMGLTAGEHLFTCLKTMDAEYRKLNRRGAEMHAAFSLRQLFPLQLVQLKQNGKCLIELPEWLFDMDNSGHYRRQLKSLAVTIPCVAGPHSRINCTLRMMSNQVRISDDVSGGYAYTPGPGGEPDPRFVNNYARLDEHGRMEALFTSHARSDAGQFQVDHRDERYQKFEGAGVISTWEIEMPRETNYFDLDTVTDVLLEMDYTAVEARSELKPLALAAVRSILPRQGRAYFAFDKEFPSEWNRLFQVPDDGSDQALRFNLSHQHFPFYAQGKTISFVKVVLLARTGSADLELEVEAEPPRRVASTFEEVTPNTDFPDLLHQELTMSNAGSFLGDWVVKVNEVGADRRSLTKEMIKSLVWVVDYRVS
jgi:hypothetical protein